MHQDRTLKEPKRKVRVAGPYTVESDNLHRAITPEEYDATKNSMVEI